jgi:predicted MPP superfamily phosphohydrolase
VDEHDVDLAVMTGDYGDMPQDAEAAAGVLERLVGRIRSRHGVYGVFGNHDGAGFVRRVRGMRGVRWLRGETVEVGEGLKVVGASFPEDLVGVGGEALRTRQLGQDEPTPQAHSSTGRGSMGFRIGLVHDPTEVYTAAALGVDVVLAGHTHGGQVRWSAGVTPHTSCDLPSGFASGMYALGGTVLCVSRGMGEAVARIRVRCPRQAGVYVLRRGGLPVGERLSVVRRW